MKCPLFIINDRRAQSGEETEIGDCLEEECAWWYEGENCCAMTAIAIDLTAIFNMVAAFQYTMPHEQQFGK